jgi:GTP-binding protein
VIVHLIDVHPLPGQPSPAEAYRVIRGELQKYSQALASKPEIVVANKIDLADTLEAVDELRSEIGQEVMAISGVAGTGLEPLGERLWTMIEDARSQPVAGFEQAEDDPFATSHDAATGENL